MIFTKLNLFAPELEPLKNFYCNYFDAELISESESSITIKIGFTEITFSHPKTNNIHHYHYCFHLPCNKLNDSIDWCKDKFDLLKIEGDRITQHFESWNADSIYFLDPAGNIAEFIVRHGLENFSDEPFSSRHILGINEVGMPTEDIPKAHEQLKAIGSTMWRGDLERFATIGDLNGIILLPNPAIKDTWFPTQMKIIPSDLRCEAIIQENTYSITYSKGKLNIAPTI